MKKKKLRRELIEWILFLGIIGILFLTGSHLTVISTLQRGLLASGLLRPNLENDSRNASYDLILTDISGNQLTIEEWRSETIFMNFWATWCAPCIAEMPDINDLHGTVGNEIKFAMVSVDKDRQKAIDFVKEKGFDFPVYFVASPIPDVYATNSIPTTYVISPEGKIVVDNKGMAQYSHEKFITFLRSL